MKSLRSYHSPLRQEQARQTRRAILDAALPLFVECGYAGTSMGDIARAAAVSIKTVEAIFGTKAKLLVALRDVTIVGDDQAIPLAERPWFQEMLAEPEPRRQLRLFAQGTCRIKHRTARLNEVIRRAAPGDPEIGQLWQVVQEQMMADLRMVAERLAAKGVLREQLDLAQAAEILWLLNHPSVYYLAIVERGWPEEQFEQWLADAFIHQLLR
jgi:AcrR family transcriptional regulator